MHWLDRAMVWFIVLVFLGSFVGAVLSFVRQ